jgi:hypothetical protein
LSDVVVKDVIPAELEIVSVSVTKGIVISEQPGKGKMGAIKLTWDIGTMEGDQTETLRLVIGTKKNPAGKQEFTSSGNYILNEGCAVTGTDSKSGKLLEAGPTDAIYVTAYEISEEVVIVMKKTEPVLILTAGLSNIEYLEDDTKSYLPVWVTAFYGDVHNVRIEVVDDAGLVIDVIPLKEDIGKGKTISYHVGIEAPKLLNDSCAEGRTIHLRAVGDEAVSNTEYISLQIQKPVETLEVTDNSEEGQITFGMGLSILSLLAFVVVAAFKKKLWD